MAASFAGVAAAFGVNVLIKPLDGILTEITNDAIHLMNPSVSIDLTANFWFSAASVLLLTIVIALITERIIEPRLGRYEGEAARRGGGDHDRGGDARAAVVELGAPRHARCCSRS